MMFLTITFCLLTCVYDTSAVDIMPELKINIFNFGYCKNFKYKGMLSHSCGKFYVVTKFKLSKVKDLKLTTVDFDPKCSYLSKNDIYHTKVIKYCLKIVSYVEFYKQQIAYYNQTT